MFKFLMYFNLYMVWEKWTYFSPTIFIKETVFEVFFSFFILFLFYKRIFYLTYQSQSHSLPRPPHASHTFSPLQSPIYSSDSVRPPMGSLKKVCHMRQDQGPFTYWSWARCRSSLGLPMDASGVCASGVPSSGPVA